MKRGPGRHRPQDIDRQVGARLRERRVMLGLSMEQMAALIGVSLQQVGKYEKGTNRVTAGRLYRIAQALDADIGYFFERTGREYASRPTWEQRLALELARDFVAIANRKHQEGIVALARALAEFDA